MQFSAIQCECIVIPDGTPQQLPADVIQVFKARDLVQLAATNVTISTAHLGPSALLASSPPTRPLARVGGPQWAPCAAALDSRG